MPPAHFILQTVQLANVFYASTLGGQRRDAPLTPVIRRRIAGSSSLQTAQGVPRPWEGGIHNSRAMSSLNADNARQASTGSFSSVSRLSLRTPVPSSQGYLP
jgi:hypothetical protein